jgi:pSer/pThr/pTyr-binding forkhead associated (FHA) protein
MALVTLRVLDGADRGRSFDNTPTPVSIGREEGNTVQLNDERISRFHLKIQEDQDKIVLTDLQSTNGTKVNGENVQVWILRPGDLVWVGKTILLFGSDREIAERLARLRGTDLTEAVPLEGDEVDVEESSAALESELFWGENPDARATLHTLLPPDLPHSLSPGQTAQLSEMLHYFNLRLRGLLQSIHTPARSENVVVEHRQWQNLLDLQRRLAGYLREIGEPDEN